GAQLRRDDAARGETEAGGARPAPGHEDGGEALTIPWHRRPACGRQTQASRLCHDKGGTMRPDKRALDRWLDAWLAELELSVRATNCLESEGIITVRDVVIRSDEELLEIRNFGETTLREVKQKLQERGLRLGMIHRDGIWTFGDQP